MIELCLGPWQALFSPEDAALRHIRWQGADALLAVYAAVRDPNWNTVSPRLEDLQIDRSAHEISIRFTARCHQNPIRFIWRSSIILRDDGTLRYDFDGQAESDFSKNRIGFCVLHHASCAGEPLQIEHTDGTLQEGRFPQEISPHQPFCNIRAIRHTLPNQASLVTRMEGDTFEMEDQRNWTDASFKTYCTPLGLPFPQPLQAGQTVRQSVALQVTPADTLDQSPRLSGGLSAQEVEISPEDREFPLPAWGLQAWGRDVTLPDHGIESRLANLGCDFIRVDFAPPESSWSHGIAPLRLAVRRGWGVELALHLTDRPDVPHQVQAMVDFLSTHAPETRVIRWLVFHAKLKSTGAPWTNLVRECLNTTKWAAPVFGGTNAYFAELNRGRPDPQSVDGVVYSINPQVHAFDDLSLIETLPMHRETAINARALASGKPVAVSPLSLRPRFNPNATAPEPEPPPGIAPASVDPRQHTVFNALWTLLALRYLSEGGALSVCLYETHGWRGVINLASPDPAPVEVLLSWLAGCRPQRISPLRSTSPLQVNGAEFLTASSRQWLLACFAATPRNVHFRSDHPLVPTSVHSLLGPPPTLINPDTLTLAPLSLVSLDLHP